MSGTPNAESVVTIKDDKAFIKEAGKLLEGSPSGTKGLTIIKLNNKGKGSRKQLYLSLAHGDFMLSAAMYLCGSLMYEVIFLLVISANDIE